MGYTGLMSKYYDKIKRKRKEADKLWKKAVFEKWGKLCEVCGKPASDPHHFFPKGQFGHLRYSLENSVPLCRSCHFSHHQKGDPRIQQKIINRRGDNWFESLKEQAKKNPKSFKNLGWYESHTEKLKEVLGA